MLLLCFYRPKVIYEPSDQGLEPLKPWPTINTFSFLGLAGYLLQWLKCKSSNLFPKPIKSKFKSKERQVWESYVKALGTSVRIDKGLWDISNTRGTTQWTPKRLNNVTLKLGTQRSAGDRARPQELLIRGALSLPKTHFINNIELEAIPKYNRCEYVSLCALQKLQDKTGFGY